LRSNLSLAFFSSLSARRAAALACFFSRPSALALALICPHNIRAAANAALPSLKQSTTISDCGLGKAQSRSISFTAVIVVAAVSVPIPATLFATLYAITAALYPIMTTLLALLPSRQAKPIPPISAW